MAHVLILYSTTDGHTLAICRRVLSVVERGGHRYTRRALDDDPDIDVAPFDAVVLGARIRYGSHHPHVMRFAARQPAALDARPNAFFTVNAVARKPEKAGIDTNPYLRKFLARSPWRPRLLGVFAGRIDYARYGFADRQVIRFIMWLTHGPTDPQACVEFTDWDQVDAFARRVAAL
jgi:menaquinone-dependent protoporphyrinogen oxidase